MKLTAKQQWKVSKALTYPAYFADLKTSEELHAFVELWNWDSGTQELSQILDHPQCDRGTALSIYWLGAAGYYRQYENREAVPSFNRAGYDLIIKAKQGLEANRYASSQFSFDTSGELSQYDDVEKKWDHSESVKTSVVGESVTSDANPDYGWQIIETLEAELHPKLGEIGLKAQTHDMDEEAVWFMNGRGQFEHSGQFQGFEWKKLSNGAGLEFSLEFVLMLNEDYCQSSRFLKRYRAEAETLEGAIRDIVRAWADEFLSLLGALPQPEIYETMTVGEKTVHWLGWSLTGRAQVKDRQLMADLTPFLEEYPTPVVMHFVPEQQAIAYTDYTCQPKPAPSTMTVDEPTLLFLI